MARFEPIILLFVFGLFHMFFLFFFFLPMFLPFTGINGWNSFVCGVGVVSLYLISFLSSYSRI